MARLKHDEGTPDLKPVSTLHTFPIYTFAENIVVRSNGNILVTCFVPGQLVNIDPKDGSVSVVHTTSIGGFSGIAELGEDVFYVSSGDLGKAGTFAITKVDMTGYVPNSKPAYVSKLLDFPDALLLNGSTALSVAAGLLLAVDSFLGLVYLTDVKAGTSSIWLKDKRLGKVTDIKEFPGVNGVKVFGGHVYFSNTDARQFLRVAINKDGTIKGEIELVEKDCIIDDFAFDSEGTVYLTSHLFNSVYTITSDGKRNTIAGGPTDRDVAGTTACPFGKGDADKEVLYVTTNGGMSMPIEGEVGPGRLLRIEVGKTGA